MFIRRRFLLKRLSEIRYKSSEEKGLSLEKDAEKIVKTQPELPKRKKAVVTLLAANNLAGHIAALSLKMRGEYVDEIRLWDNASSTRGVSMELSMIPTPVKILSYVGDSQLQASLRHTDIVVILGGSWGLPNESSSDLFYKNADHVREMSQAIIVSCPRAIIGLAVPPLTSMVAFFGEMQREQGTFCPNRLLGVLAMEEARARSLVSKRLGLPPGVVSVRLTGGGTPASLIPVISSATPGGHYIKDEVLEMTTFLRNMTEKIKAERDGKGPEMSAGLGVANFVRTLAKGLYSGKKTSITAVVRTSCLYGVPYLALPVTLGPGGILATVGIPRLSEHELRLLIQALPRIMEDISIGETWAHASRQSAIAAQ